MSLVELVESDAEQAIERFESFHQRYAPYFSTQTRTMAKEAKQYLHGQLLCRRRGNMVQFEKIVPKSNSQSLNHFISNSPWQEEPLLDDIARDVSECIGDWEYGSLHMDESGFPKEGTHSVGVKRQYCGRLGKVESCQIGVFLGYTHQCYRVLLDRRLYLPKDWVNDQERRKECGVPKEVVFRSKAQLGLEMVREAQRREIPYAWVGMDCHYGQQQWLLEQLEDDGELYIADIPSDSRIWLEYPKTEIPPRKGNRGRNPTRLKVVGSPIEVRQLSKQLQKHHWRGVYVRDTERGELWTRLACLRVYPVRDGLPGPETWLILREDEGENKVKYQFCNAPTETPFGRLAEMSHSRYWMERAIQDAKGEVGLDEYELRGWRGWHHHMTMTILAMLFLLELQIDWKPKAPNLTVQDVREILEVILPRREITSKEILEIIEQKHKARISARPSHHRKQKLKSKI
jgi:SRSO17 transposase